MCHLHASKLVAEIKWTRKSRWIVGVIAVPEYFRNDEIINRKDITHLWLTIVVYGFENV